MSIPKSLYADMRISNPRPYKALAAQRGIYAVRRETIYGITFAAVAALKFRARERERHQSRGRA
jgi:hypothetical protein